MSNGSGPPGGHLALVLLRHVRDGLVLLLGIAGARVGRARLRVERRLALALEGRHDVLGDELERALRRLGLRPLAGEEQHAAEAAVALLDELLDLRGGVLDRPDRADAGRV